MKMRPMGQSGVEASVVAFGAWAIGGWMWGGRDDNEAVKAIHAAIDAGINMIDTAPMYGFGHSETVVGKAIAGRRDEVVIATKCGLIWHEEAGDYFFSCDDTRPGKSGKVKIHRCLRPDVIRYEVELSLSRLGIDVIDLYQTHWQETTTPIEDTMGELLRLKEEGKIRAIGCSNATPEQMDAYRAVCPLDVDQEKYSMLDRGHDEANLPYCAEQNIAFLAYSPLAQGLLTGKVGPERTFAKGDQRNYHKRFSVENREKIKTLLLDAITPVAEEHGITLGQLAIAWSIHQPGCTHALVGARTPEQVIENAKAGAVDLSADELATIQEAIAAYTASLEVQ